MSDNKYEIEYAKWGKVGIKTQFIIATLVCLIEILNNALLYVTRSQGYGPDTIVEKLIRYLFLTSIVNFGMVIASAITEAKVKDDILKRYLIMTFTTIMCTNVAYSHYQFATTLAIFVVPIFISMLYEDWKLSIYACVISFVGQGIAIAARASDPEYNKDIGPEAAIALTLTLSLLMFARIITDTLKKRRNDVKEAVIAAEKANASAEKMVFSMKMLETLAGTLDAKDKYTNGHSLRVAIYSTKLAEAIGWDKSKVDMLRYEALLHDIGKIGVPDSILNKPSRLTDMEFGLIKSHTIVGSDILKNMVAVPGASEVARHHHERYDGKGYPDAIAGERISINARIVCIADAYDAMSSDRIYRKALSPDIIRSELVGGRGTQFDPVLLDKFVELFDSKQLEIKDSLSIGDSEDKDKQDVLNDIRNMLYVLNDASERKYSRYDFDKFYKYMRNIGLRYNRSVEVLQVDIEKSAEGEASVTENEAAEVLQVAIRKNIRAVDMYHKYSDNKHMIILLDAGVDNVDVVKKRIQFDYDGSAFSNEYKLKFTLNDYMEAPGKSEE